MISRKTGIALALAVVILAVTATALAFTDDGDQKVCPEGQSVAQVHAVHGNDSLTVDNPPPGSVAAGGGQRIDVEKGSATLHGAGTFVVTCRE